VAGNPGTLNYGQKGMANNLIKNGTLYYLGTDAGYPLFKINTVAGTFTTSTLAQATLDGVHGEQTSEDVTNSIYWFGSWSETTTHPAYIGNWMLTLGHQSGSTMAFRYFVGPTLTPPVAGIPAGSRKRAWSFVADGHVFYVLDLGTQGTYLFDDTTQKWCKFITQNYWQWNLTNGTMWGDRIVGGDILGVQIWEMQPAATFDNGSTPIIHVASGSLSSRHRDYTSVEALRLAFSIGGVLDANVTVSLSFSDDQALTFTAMPDQVITSPGTYSGEIAWRSLGSFDQLGRLWYITDVGGNIRLDGCDAFLDAFDDEGQPGQDSGGG
jgi:hypothetical protein